MIKEFDIKKDFAIITQRCRDLDKWAINIAGVPGVVLMENAGRSCAEIIISELKRASGKKVCMFCGTGNNGGDGFVIARHLHNAALSPVVILCGDKTKIKGDAEINYKIITNMGLPIKQLDLATANIKEQISSLTADCDLIVDAMFGTGFRGVLSDGFDIIAETINSLGKTIVAVDCPSGLDCDTGLPSGPAVKADITVTFAVAKVGFKNPESQKYTGKIYVASIGIEPVLNAKATCCE